MAGVFRGVQSAQLANGTLTIKGNEAKISVNKNSKQIIVSGGKTFKSFPIDKVKGLNIKGSDRVLGDRFDVAIENSKVKWVDIDTGKGQDKVTIATPKGSLTTIRTGPENTDWLLSRTQKKVQEYLPEPIGKHMGAGVMPDEITVDAAKSKGEIYIDVRAKKGAGKEGTGRLIIKNGTKVQKDTFVYDPKRIFIPEGKKNYTVE